MRALGLPVPARHARQAVGDVANLDIERGGVEEIETPPRQHALPGPGGVAVSSGAVCFGGIDLLISSSPLCQKPGPGQSRTCIVAVTGDEVVVGEAASLISE